MLSLKSIHGDWTATYIIIHIATCNCSLQFMIHIFTVLCIIHTCISIHANVYYKRKNKLRTKIDGIKEKKGTIKGRK